MSERGGPLPSENSQTMQVVGKKTPGRKGGTRKHILSLFKLIQVESGF